MLVSDPLSENLPITALHYK